MGDENPRDDEAQLKIYSKRTRTPEGRTYYDIVLAGAWDIDMGERGLSH